MLDAVVVLGCKVGLAHGLSRAAARRAERAARAYHYYLPRYVICSGGRNWQGEVEAMALAERLLELGVAEERILTECRSLSTCENAAYVSELAAERQLGRLALVTCDWHLNRALRAFAAVGLPAVGLSAPAPLREGRRRWRSWREKLSWPLDRLSTFGLQGHAAARSERP